MSSGSAVGLSGDVWLLRTLKTVLPALNFKVIAPPAPVPSADEASPAEIRLALIDADYPETAAVLKWLEPDRRIPVILMRAGDAPLPAALRGAAAVLSKPVDPNKLRAAVELVLPDWEEPIDCEPYLADILDLFGPENPRADSTSGQDRDGRSADPAREDEIDVLLGPALSEIGIAVRKDGLSSGLPPGMPRWPDPRATRPSPPGIPAPPAASSAEKTPEDAESCSASFETLTDKKGKSFKRILRTAGLAAIALVGATYIGFGPRTMKPAFVPSASAAPQAAGKIPRSDPSAGPMSIEKQEQQAPKPAETPVPPTAAGPQKLVPANDPDEEKSVPIEAPSLAALKMAPETHAPAGLFLSPKSEPTGQNDPSAKPASEAPAAAPKADPPEPAPGPETVKSGDLMKLAAVDKLPILLKGVEPVYPPLAYQDRVEAKVMLSVLISEKGDVIDAKLSGDTSANQGFAKAALRAVRLWVFSPAFKNGVAVRVWKPVVIDFKIR